MIGEVSGMISRVKSSTVAVSITVILGLVSALLFLPAAVANANAQIVPTKPCVVLTKNDELVKTRCRIEANDLHVKFSGNAAIVFTLDGKPISDPIRKPIGANDFHVIWDQETGKIVKFWWTRDGELIGDTKEPPGGANDLHLKVTKEIRRVIWTHDGEKIGSISVPDGTNHLNLIIRHKA